MLTLEDYNRVCEALANDRNWHSYERVEIAGMYADGGIVLRLHVSEKVRALGTTSLLTGSRRDHDGVRTLGGLLWASEEKFQHRSEMLPFVMEYLDPLLEIEAMRAAVEELSHGPA